MFEISELEKLAQLSGLTELRPAQTRAFSALNEGRDLLVVWPTGSGKSLVYQLPALVLPKLTLVVSPLIALMDDQVAKANQNKWPFTCVHSGLAREERERRLARVKAGKVKLLYVTPERFRQPEFVEILRGVGVSLLAVDEAHCISQWGQDFRPDYSRLGEILASLGHPPTVALTATATREVQGDIRKQLGFSAEALTLWEGVERPNLFLGAQEFEHADEKLDALVGWLKETKGPKIVYFTLIKNLSIAAAGLRAREFTQSYDVYHGDLGDGERRRSLRRFLGGESELMLATPAFGLGVDKPDVRGVLHFELPGSLEAYFQEVGRAGRDGLPSRGQLFYAPEDLETQMRFIETLTPEPDYVSAVYRLLEQWRDRLNTVSLDDLRAQLSFKNARDFRLETALSFLDRWGVIDFRHRRLDRLVFLRALEPGDLTPELWAARRKTLQLKLLALVQWFRADECRKVGLYRYFGRVENGEDAKPCGFCDWCEATHK